MKSAALRLVVAQAIGQISLIAAIPVLTRLLTVSEIGVYQTGFSIAVVLQPLATLRRELLIPVSPSGSVHRLRLGAIRFSVIFSTLLVALSGLLVSIGVLSLAATVASAALVLLSLAVQYIENSYLIRQGATSRLAWRNLIGGISSSVLQVLVALAIPSGIAVAAALLLGRVVAAMATAERRPLMDDSLRSDGRTDQRTISAILSAMVASAAGQAVIVGSFVGLGAHASAQVAVGQRIAGAPASLVGQALTQVALTAASPMIRNKEPGLASMLAAHTLRIAGFAAFTAVVIALIAPLAAIPVLGPGYAMAGILTAVYAVPLCLTLVALPATSLLIPLGRERLLLGIQVGRLAAVAAALLVSASLFGDLLLSSIVTAVVWSLAYLPLLWAAFGAAAAHDRACRQGSGTRSV